MISFFLLAAQAAAAAQPMTITCVGGGNAATLTMGTAWGYNHYLGSTQVSTLGTGSRGYGDSVDLTLFAGDDRIRLPRTLLPPMHGGKNGWFKLRNVQATDRTIDAVAGVNFANSPKVHIDRATGAITISAGQMGSYFGTCEKVDTSAPAKF